MNMVSAKTFFVLITFAIVLFVDNAQAGTF